MGDIRFTMFEINYKAYINEVVLASKCLVFEDETGGAVFGFRCLILNTNYV